MLTPRLIESVLEACTVLPRQIFVAYSGGVDSHVLLHLCAQSQSLRERLTAVHVHHGLQSRADAWAVHAEQTAHRLGVKFLLRRVDARPGRGQSPEEAARDARYRALEAVVTAAGDALLVAQHQDDQLETVLLQLLRGGGLPGLSGMPASMPFGKGMLIRPFLGVRKHEIDRYAADHDLEWVEDPTNRSCDYDRNYLRQQVLPLLKRRWPACDRTVARAANHCAEAQVLLDDMAGGLFREVRQSKDNTLDIARLAAFDPARQRLIVRYWCAHMGLKMPSESFLAELFENVIAARTDSDPVLRSQSLQFRRYRNKLYCLPSFQPELMRALEWPLDAESLELGQPGKLVRIASPTGIPVSAWLHSRVTVGFRSGGESIALPGRKGRHRLKNLFQERGIPPWERPAIPLVHLDGRLAAVGDLWISAEFFCDDGRPCFRPEWRRG